MANPIGAIGSEDHANNIKKKKEILPTNFNAAPHAGLAFNPVNNIGNFLNGSMKTENV